MSKKKAERASHLDLIGNEIQVGDVVAGVIEYEDLCLCKVIRVTEKRVVVQALANGYHKGTYPVSSNQMIKLNPEDVTMHLLKSGL